MASTTPLKKTLLVNVTSPAPLPTCSIPASLGGLTINLDNIISDAYLACELSPAVLQNIYTSAKLEAARLGIVSTPTSDATLASIEVKLMNQAEQNAPRIRRVFFGTSDPSYACECFIGKCGDAGNGYAFDPNYISCSIGNNFNDAPPYVPPDGSPTTFECG